MKTNECVVIIPTHESYLDICDIFLTLFRKYWPDCPYKVVMSVTGKEPPRLLKEECFYNGDKVPLTQCVLNASNQYNADLYLVFLGDAFFTRKIDNVKVKRLINFLLKEKTDYCCLRLKHPEVKVKRVTEYARKINKKDRYHHSFIAFAASKKFLNEEFGSGVVESDYDFELKYLQIANGTDKAYFSNRLILTKNVFHIKPGIDKGKWDRGVLRYLMKRNPEIIYSNRKKLSVREQTIVYIQKILLLFIPASVRQLLKKWTAKLFGKKFVTMT